MYKNYIIVYNTSFFGLEDEVNKKIEEGYNCL